MDSDDLHEDQRRRDWHFDRRVPITVLIVIVLQTASAVWYAAKLDSRVQAVERDQLVQHERDSQQDANVREAISLLREQLNRIEGNLYRLLERTGANGTGGK